MEYVFISYVRENAELIDRLASALRKAGVKVWLDREMILPGQRWRTVIRNAIQEGAFFIACFSHESAARDRTYMNEELTLAIEELRLRPADRSWFIPVLLSGGAIPERSIGGSETLADLQHVNLGHDWNSGVSQLISSILSTRETPVSPQPTEEDIEMNSQFRIEVVEVAPSANDDQLGNPEPLIVARRLANFGFNVSLGGWDSSRFLARYDPERENSLYIVHRSDAALADRLARALTGLDAAPRVIMITTAEVSAASNNLEEHDIIEHVDALVAFRATP
jgi:hypothetical protein